MGMMEIGLGGALVLALNIYAIYAIMTSSRSAMAKVLWTILVLLLPIVGFVIWLLIGPRSASPALR